MSDPTVDPVITLKDLLRDQWSISTPGTASVTFQVYHPAPEKAGTFVAVTRPLPEQYFTSGQRRTQFNMGNIGASPSGMYRESVEIECQVKSPDNKQTVLAAKWNMMREVKRIVQSYGGAGTANTKYVNGDWQHDDFGSDPTIAVSRGVVTAIYWK